MPYADPEKAKEAKRKSFLKRYYSDPAYQKSEAEKKAAWLQTDHGRELNAESSRRARLKAKRARKRTVSAKPRSG